MVHANGHDALPLNSPHPLVTFRQATLRDVHAMASVVLGSFQDAQTSHFTSLILDLTPKEQRRRESGMYQRRVKGLKHQLATPRCLTRVALCDGEVIGCAEWLIYLGTQKPRQLQTYLRKLTFREKLLHIYVAFVRKVRNHFPAWPKWLSDWLWPISDEQQRLLDFGETTMQRRREACRDWIPGTMAEKDYLILNSLSVLPGYQGRGIGKVLVQYGLDIAREAGVPIYLVASPAGKRLYERMGFLFLHEYDTGDPESRETVMKYEAL